MLSGFMQNTLTQCPQNRQQATAQGRRLEMPLQVLWGAQGVVLGCTELEMVVDVDANVLPIFDSTRIHCEAAADWILEQES